MGRRTRDERKPAASRRPGPRWARSQRAPRQSPARAAHPLARCRLRAPARWRTRRDRRIGQRQEHPGAGAHPADAPPGRPHRLCRARCHGAHRPGAHRLPGTGPTRVPGPDVGTEPPAARRLQHRSPAASPWPPGRAAPRSAGGRTGPSRRAGEGVGAELVDGVGLAPALANRWPHELSGGQRQRVNIARALALAPRVLIADEVTSGLDVSAQARIVALLESLRRDTGLSLIFISHDLSLVRSLCDDLLILRAGEVVEAAPADQVFAAPAHDYTRALLAAIALTDPDRTWIERR